MAIGVALVLLSALPHCRSEILEHSDGVLPVDTRVGDAHALLEAGGSLRWDLLVALVDVRLDHDTNDGLLALAKLVADVLGDLGLVAVVLARVTCGYTFSSGQQFSWDYEILPCEQSTMIAIFWPFLAKTSLASVMYCFS